MSLAEDFVDWTLLKFESRFGGWPNKIWKLWTRYLISKVFIIFELQNENNVIFCRIYIPTLSRPKLWPRLVRFIYTFWIYLPFVYQFYYRMTIVIESIFEILLNYKFAFKLFHNHFKIFWYGALINIRGIFCFYLFWGTAKWQVNW